MLGVQVTVKSNRTLGIVAACFSVLGVLSQVTSLFQYAQPNPNASYLWIVGVSSSIGVLSFIGLILFLIAMYGFSKDYNEAGIFNNLKNGIIAVVVAGIIAIVLVVVIFVVAMPTSIINGLLTTIPIFAVIGLIWVVFNVRAFNLLSDTSKVPLFRTAALILLAGAAVTVAISILVAIIGPSLGVGSSALSALSIPGGLVQDVAWVLFAVAYSRIQPPPTPVYTPAYAPPSQPTTPPLWETKYCSNCGAPIEANAAYCSRCGKKL